MSPSLTLRITNSDPPTVPVMVKMAPSGALKPPTLLPSVPDANTNDPPGARVIDVSESSNFTPPDRSRLPVNVEAPLFVTVRNPVSGLAQYKPELEQPPN